MIANDGPVAHSPNSTPGPLPEPGWLCLQWKQDGVIRIAHVSINPKSVECDREREREREREGGRGGGGGGGGERAREMIRTGCASAPSVSSSMILLVFIEKVRLSVPWQRAQVLAFSTFARVVIDIAVDVACNSPLMYNVMNISCTSA